MVWRPREGGRLGQVDDAGIAKGKGLVAGKHGRNVVTMWRKSPIRGRKRKGAMNPKNVYGELVKF